MIAQKIDAFEKEIRENLRNATDLTMHALWTGMMYAVIRMKKILMGEEVSE